MISAYSKNPKGAVLLVDYMTSAPVMKRDAAKYSLPPATKATWDEPAVKRALPYAAELQRSVEAGHARPVSPVYPQISQAIYKHVNEALSGRTSPEDALKAADADINKALKTF